MTLLPESYTCPDCGAISFHPEDVRYGYCGRCFAFTGEPKMTLAQCEEIGGPHPAHPWTDDEFPDDALYCPGLP